jgi:hypothetical protein
VFFDRDQDRLHETLSRRSNIHFHSREEPSDPPSAAAVPGSTDRVRASISQRSVARGNPISEDVPGSPQSA